MKKILSISLTFIMLITIFTGCSSKNTVTIKMDVNGDVVTQEYKTDKTTLEELLVEKTDELKLTLTDSDYGKYIEGINGYTPDYTKNEYVEILVDGVSSPVGIKEITLADGQVYTLQISVFEMTES